MGRKQAEHRCDRCGAPIDPKGEFARAMVQAHSRVRVKGDPRWDRKPWVTKQKTAMVAPAKKLCMGCAQGAQDALDAYARGE